VCPTPSPSYPNRSPIPPSLPCGPSIFCEHTTHLSQSSQTAWVANLLADHLNILPSSYDGLVFSFQGKLSGRVLNRYMEDLNAFLPRSTSAVCLVYLEPNVKMALKYPVLFFVFMCCTVKKKKRKIPCPLKENPCHCSVWVGGAASVLTPLVDILRTRVLCGGFVKTNLSGDLGPSNAFFVFVW